jgi:hypothetical protein
MWQGLRKDSPDEMEGIAKALGATDIAAVAAYYQQARSPDGQSGKLTLGRLMQCMTRHICPPLISRSTLPHRSERMLPRPN